MPSSQTTEDFGSGFKLRPPKSETSLAQTNTYCHRLSSGQKLLINDRSESEEVTFVEGIIRYSLRKYQSNIGKTSGAYGYLTMLSLCYWLFLSFAPPTPFDFAMFRAHAGCHMLDIPVLQAFLQALGEVEVIGVVKTIFQQSQYLKWSKTDSKNWLDLFHTFNLTDLTVAWN